MRGESIDSIRVIEKNQMAKIGIEIREFERGKLNAESDAMVWYVVSKSDSLRLTTPGDEGVEFLWEPHPFHPFTKLGINHQ